MDARGQPVPVSRPRYPQVQAPVPASHSSTSSAFNSSSSVASISPGSAQQASLMPPTFNPNSSVPLPSPSREQHGSSYFGSLQAQPQNAFAQRAAAASQQCSTEAAGQTYVGQRGDGNGAPVTAPFLNNFNLVAEAAKRAQVACLTRDLGDVGL